jgi:hypothetical protein
MLHQIGHNTFLNDLWSLTSIWNSNTIIQHRKAAHTCSGPTGDVKRSVASTTSIRKQGCKQNALIFRNSVTLSTDRLRSSYVIASSLLYYKFGWLALRKPFSTCTTHSAWDTSPSGFKFENLGLYGAVKEAKNWRLDVSKFPLKVRIASARQSNTTI